MREAIDRFDAVAAGSGARIVHSCGFDSIPSDLGVLALHEAVTADGAGQLQDTTLVVRAMKGGPSGGTIASLKGTVDDARRTPSWRECSPDPYALSPDRDAEPRLGPEPRPARRAKRPRARRMGRPVHHGVDQHTRRATQQRTTGLGLRTPVSLPGGDGLRVRSACRGCRPARSPAASARWWRGCRSRPRARCSTGCCPPPARARARSSASGASSASRSTRGPRAARATSAASPPRATRGTRRRR